jgi:hypothetical protein
MMAHDALRLDMQDIAAALTTLKVAIDGGAKLTPFQIGAVTNFWPRFWRTVHEHHDHEEGKRVWVCKEGGVCMLHTGLAVR